ncbi:alpha/beta hydrolase [Duganella sp. FT50W]|uniref:Alpha/beta hydrolase n=1 Tax=Duganella lactea TaxID=2692173 RepID=A0A6L8MFZ7_9BURK|nr:gamma-mobile-trio protein GmtX [Duganella lactea]MYM81813.1 alpha/beta hydrolase [Duganella lactea]
MMVQAKHPDIHLAELISKGGRPVKLRNLQAIHELCRAQYEAGTRDFSVASIGKLCERAGILTARGLYNAPLADYRALIESWAAYAGPSIPKPVKQLASEDYLMRIDDPAIRAIVQGVIAERNKLKAQLNTLKANTTIVVDRRPLQAPASHGTSAVFTDSERKALSKAVSPEFIESQGWREVDFGEVVNSRGRTVFDPGFASGIRKLLSSWGR